MAVMPGAHFLDAVRGSLMARYDIVCIHTIVGYAPANAAHFSTQGNGYVWQSRDTRYRSAANFNGNPRVIAVENEDHGSVFGAWSGSNVPSFTPAQIEALAQICAWSYRAHGIPLVHCPDSKPGSRGIAFHRQGIDGAFVPYNGRVAGGEVWSTSRGKACPGDRRIAQMGQIITRARQLAGLEVEDDVAAADVWKQTVTWTPPGATKPVTVSYGQLALYDNYYSGIAATTITNLVKIIAANEANDVTLDEFQQMFDKMTADVAAAIANATIDVDVTVGGKAVTTEGN